MKKVAILLVFIFAVSAYAAENPYDKYQPLRSEFPAVNVIIAAQFTADASFSDYVNLIMKEMEKNVSPATFRTLISVISQMFTLYVGQTEMVLDAMSKFYRKEEKYFAENREMALMVQDFIALLVDKIAYGKKAANEILSMK